MDGSPLSLQALRYALSTFSETTISVLHVIDLFEPGPRDDASAFEPMIGTDDWYHRAEAASEQLFEEASEIADDYDRTVSTTSEIGDPARITVDLAVEEDLDQIVLGAHGRSSESRAVFGSVAQTVARRAPIPVTIVR